ncbi:MAG: AraC family transcriptional regulator [Rikenellaceae bacterium]|nr:AraC family transcriptional regulator [Rikenellaceae bacterium]
MRHIMNEKLVISENNPVKARFYNYDYFKYPWHFHREYEIMYVKKGFGKCFVGDNIVPYSDGDLILFGPSLPHYMSSDELYKKRECILRTEGTIIQFEYDFMQHSIKHYPQFRKIKNLLEDSSRGVKIKTAYSPTIAKLTEEMPLNSGIEQITNLLLLLNEISGINDKSFLSSQHYASTLTNVINTRLNKILSYINSNYTKKIKLNEVASVIAMKPTAFCRFFKDSTGKTFTEYLLELRVGYACKLLLLKDMNISQICIECGFETVSHFNRIFKRITGYSPTTYRNNMLK